MQKFMDIGEIPSMLSFLCAVLTILLPLVFNWLVKTAKRNGSPPWREEEDCE